MNNLAFIGLIVLVLVLCKVLVQVSGEEKQEKAAKAEARRREAEKLFRDDISEGDFERIVRRVEKRVRRVESLTVDGHRVLGVAWAQSGLSKWEFSINFDSYGHLSSDWSTVSDNPDSNIPNAVAKQISDGIERWTTEEPMQSEQSQPKGRRAAYCPYCGVCASQGGAYCPGCGRKLPVVPR